MIKVDKTDIKLSMYADDMTGLVIGISSVKNVIDIVLRDWTASTKNSVV